MTGRLWQVAECCAAGDEQQSFTPNTAAVCSYLSRLQICCGHGWFRGELLFEKVTLWKYIDVYTVCLCTHTYIYIVNVSQPHKIARPVREIPVLISMLGPLIVYQDDTVWK